MSNEAVIKAAESAMSKAITWLVLSEPWFASLALRLRTVATFDTPTADVDGVTLRYNPERFLSWPKPEQRTVVAHEVMHCALRHMTRRGSRDAKMWNIAADHVINNELTKANFALPAEALRDPRFIGMSTDAVYALIQKEEAEDPGRHSGKEDQLGGVIDAPAKMPAKAPKPGDGPRGPVHCCGDGIEHSGDCEDSDDDSGGPEAIEREWDKAVDAANLMARKAGKTPGGMERMVAASRSVNNYRDVLEQHMRVPDDYAWTRPNRRFVARGIYLPGTIVNRVRHVVIIVDTSGSVDAKMLSTFGAEAFAVMANAGIPELTTVLYCDAQINREESYSAGDIDGFELKAVGGGGTLFKPAFARVAELHDEAPVDVIFYLTDLYAGDHVTEADAVAPTVWVTPEWVTIDGNFGQTIRIPANG